MAGAGVGYDAVYSNTPSADAFLSRQSDEYVGGLAMVNHVRYLARWCNHCARTWHLVPISHLIQLDLVAFWHCAVSILTAVE